LYLPLASIGILLALVPASSGGAAAEARALFDAGRAASDRGDIASAIASFRAASDLYESAGPLSDAERSGYVVTLTALASRLQARGSREEAEAVCRRATAASTAPSDVSGSLVLLASFFVDRQEYGEAESTARRALNVSEKAAGHDDAGVARALNVLADVRIARGDPDGADLLLRRAQRAAEGPDGSKASLAAVVGRRGLLRLAVGRYPDAEAMLEQSVELAEESLGPEHPSLFHVLQALGDCYRLRNRPHEAQAAYERSLSIGERVYGAAHRELRATVTGLALVAQRLDDRTAARQWQARAAAIDDGGSPTRVAKR